MRAVRVWVWAILRQRWRATVVLSVLIGIAGAAALGAADGARRTQTAFPRMREEAKAADLLVSVGGTGLTGYYDAVARLPGVEAAGPIAGIPLATIDQNGKPSPNGAIIPVVATDARTFIEVHRPKILAGRMFDPSAPDEAVVDPAAASVLHARAGDRVTMFLFTSQTQDSTGAQVLNLKNPPGIRVSFRIVGITVTPEAVVPTTPLDAQAHFTTTPAFFQSQPSLHVRGNLNYDGTFVRLKRGANFAAFEAQASALTSKFPDTFGGAFIQNESQAADREQRAIVPLAIALYAFAGLVAIAIVFVIGQAIARQQFVEADDFGTLRALGITRVQIIGLELIRVGIVVVAGVVVALALSLAVSPFMPIGAARIAEMHPGFEANLAVLALGAAAILILLLGRAVLPAVRASRAEATQLSMRTSMLADAAARAGFAPPAAAGIRMAFEQHHGKRSLPLRSALAGTIVGLAALVAALMFGTSLTRLITVPAEYGQQWDAMVDSSFGFFPLDRHRDDLTKDPNIVGFTAGDYASLTIGGRDVPAVGLDRLKGDVYPAILAGREVRRDDEIVLGTLAMHRAHTAIGKTIEVTVPGERSRAMKVVGRAVFPTLGRGSFAPTSLGDGAAVTASTFAALESALNPTPTKYPYNFLLVKFRPGADRAAIEKRLSSWFVDPECAATNDCSEVSEQRPIELGVLTRVRSAPLILAGLLALFAAATLAHALLTSVRLRAHDLAILKTMGFVRNQIRATVAWQTSALALAMLVVGLPLGVIAGRAVWAAFASTLGVPSHAAVSIVAFVVTIPATLLLANIIGALPARAAARTEAAVVLRTE